MEKIQKLIKLAKKVQENSYSPYSKFKVGVALLTHSEEYCYGCNIENAAYPEGICAEGASISEMISKYGNHQTIKEIVVLSPNHEICSPCGGCRQKIREFSKNDTKIHLVTSDEKIQTFSMDEILPLSFGPDNLES